MSDMIWVNYWVICEQQLRSGSSSFSSIGNDDGRDLMRPILTKKTQPHPVGLEFCQSLLSVFSQLLEWKSAAVCWPGRVKPRVCDTGFSLISPSQTHRGTWQPQPSATFSSDLWLDSPHLVSPTCRSTDLYPMPKRLTFELDPTAQSSVKRSYSRTSEWQLGGAGIWNESRVSMGTKGELAALKRTRQTPATLRASTLLSTVLSKLMMISCRKIRAARQHKNIDQKVSQWIFSMLLCSNRWSFSNHAGLYSSSGPFIHQYQSVLWHGKLERGFTWAQMDQVHLSFCLIFLRQKKVVTWHFPEGFVGSRCHHSCPSGKSSSVSEGWIPQS